MTWEYLAHSFPISSLSSRDMRQRESECIMNGYGSEGWELVGTAATTEGPDLLLLTFKRPHEGATSRSSRRRDHA